MRIYNSNKKFLYLISPNKIDNQFLKDLKSVLKYDKINFFQLRLKNESIKKKIIIGKKIKKICYLNKVKFLINDDPWLAKKINADGCHLGQKDTKIEKAREILGNKIIGVTCHNSLRLGKKAIMSGADYIAIGAFYRTKTKKVKFKAKFSTIKKLKKLSNIPIVAIGGITNKNYKNLLLNKANFLAISGYIFNNKKYKPVEAIKKLK